MALFSSKGYAIGANFSSWLAHKMRTTQRQADELISSVEDLLAICGGRDYVFFLDAAVVDRFSQFESLYGYLLEETDLGAAAGGQLRHAILTGFQSVYCMAAVKAMAVISDAWLWPMLRAIEPGPRAHICDVCPHLWPRVCTWLEEAAEDPAAVVDGTLCLRTSLEAAALRTTPLRPPGATERKRAHRAEADMKRIKQAFADSDELKELVWEMLGAAFREMALSVRNHASEWMPGGRFCVENMTAELRTRLDGMPLTSVAAETMFSRLKSRSARMGRARHDTLAGSALVNRDRSDLWVKAKAAHKQAAIFGLARASWRQGSGSRTIADERALAGAAKAPAREEKLAKKRAGKSKKAAELKRLSQLEIASTFSALKKMRNDELADQLRIHKLILLNKEVGRTAGSRTELVKSLQPLIIAKFGPSAYDLEAGDEGLWGQGLRRRRAEGSKRQRKASSRWVVQGDWEWDSSLDYQIDRLTGRMVADGKTPIPGRDCHRIKPGTVLYRVLWEGWPEELSTWEEEDDIPCGEVDFIAIYEDLLDGSSNVVSGSDSGGDTDEDVA